MENLQEYLKILSSILNEDELNVLRKTKLNQVKDIHGEMGYNACGKIIVARVIEPIVYELMRNDHIKTALILANQIVSFGNPIDSHFFISNVVNILYSKHEIDNAIGFAKKDFEMRNLYMNNLIINERQIASCPAWKRLIDLYVEKGKFKEAVEICETVIALNPIDINKYNSIIKKLNKEFVGNEQFTIDSENSNIKDEIYPKDKTYVFIDVETAVGFDIICSIGMIILKNGEVIKINQLINPETPISHGNTQIHGIKDEDVKDKPTFINFWKSIEDYKLENIIYVGHNVRFDLRKINEGHKQYGVNDFHSSRIIDTMDVAKKYYYKDNTIQGDLKLDRLADIFGIKFNHHDAMSDIETTKKVLEKLILNYNLDIKALEKKYDPNK